MVDRLEDPVRILVGFPAGGGTDAIARTLAERLKDELGAPVIVENRAGAGGQIAAQALKAAPADGSTYFISHDHTISILPLVVKNPGFDPAQDFVPVAGFATFVNALAVAPGTPAKNFKEYIATIRAQGGKSAVGVPAPASVPEFLVKVISEKYKLDLVAVPYRGSAPMIADMLASQSLDLYNAAFPEPNLRAQYPAASQFSDAAKAIGGDNDGDFVVAWPCRAGSASSDHRMRCGCCCFQRLASPALPGSPPHVFPSCYLVAFVVSLFSNSSIPRGLYDRT